MQESRKKDQGLGLVCVFCFVFCLFMFSAHMSSGKMSGLLLIQNNESVIIREQSLESVDLLCKIFLWPYI